MKYIFVNLKRFEVPRRQGGLCTYDSPCDWVEWILTECVRNGLGRRSDLCLTFLLPEALIPVAVSRLAGFHSSDTERITIGCQGVYRENIKPGGNFGAFTANRPAAAAKAIGCAWALIGHSEERKDKLGIINEFLTDSRIDAGMTAPADTVSRLIGQEAAAALESGMRVLLCVGETEAERGTGNITEQQARTQTVLKTQLQLGLQGIREEADQAKVIIAYEPVWAIGPGKTPPGKEYIAFVSAYVKETVRSLYGFEPAVVYGGGLKEENARMICSIESIAGGLVALTRFTGDIGFYPDDLTKIIDECQGNKEGSAE